MRERPRGRGVGEGEAQGENLVEAAAPTCASTGSGARRDCCARPAPLRSSYGKG